MSLTSLVLPDRTGSCSDDSSTGTALNTTRDTRKAEPPRDLDRDRDLDLDLDLEWSSVKEMLGA